MEELKVIGVESGSLLVASEEGNRYRVAIDDVLQSRLRQSSPEPGNVRKLSPREIQSHIRAGMSAEDVAAITGVPLDYVQRFEGPVLAEREFVIESALAVPVQLANETDPFGGGVTFGTVIRRRLADGHAIGERWASWKEEGGGWVVKLTFVAETIDHDARWSFDPKKSTLAPLNQEAITLSQQGEQPANLLPRLRAVPLDEQADAARFDSGAFNLSPADTAPSEAPFSGPSYSDAQTGPLLEPVPYGRVGDVELLPVKKNQTADLLEALRKRRGERDPMDPDPEESIAARPSTGTVRLIDIPLDGTDEVPIDSMRTKPTARDTGPNGRRGSKGRASMPSWDEIVFGARTDDDL
ncbi:septation protein SepH [Pseudolysinimonas sp.]|uniref:septation protein SepH n=1 Tax=Pseudolysinimonas sp. TaxID=2680009 RepID=UPI00286AE533|nr:septation protein SepH [Pseudolysinimonas sp.]